MSVFLRVAMLFSFIGASFAAPSAWGQSGTGGALDGQVFEGSLVVQSTGVRLPERIVFDLGELQSNVCLSFGIANGPYSAQVRGGVIRFRSYGETIALGQVYWLGTITGDELMATVDIRHEGEPASQYVVTATRVLPAPYRKSEAGSAATMALPMPRLRPDGGPIQAVGRVRWVQMP